MTLKNHQGGPGKVSPHPEQLLESLIHQQIVSEASVTSFLTARTVGIADEAFQDVLDEMRTSGLLSAYQRQKIGDSGTDSLRFGPYVLLDYLGRGGMGEVLLARHVDLDRQVALKILPPRLTDSAERRERFRHEIRLLAKLDHPGIVKAVDAGHWNNIPYLAMEYVPGGTLHAHLRNEGPLAWNRLVRWMIEACEAIAYAHERGIIHRDIKPSNLAIDEHQHVKVLDLGLASATRFGEQETGSPASQVPSDELLGTIDFMSPEQSTGAAVGPAADIYSLGCAMFTLLTGQPIFPGKNSREKVEAHSSQPAPSVVELRPEVPSELESLIHDLVAKTPAQRPSSMRNVVCRLYDIAEQYQLGDSTIQRTLTGPSNNNPSSPGPTELAATASVGNSPTRLVARERVHSSQRKVQAAGYVLIGMLLSCLLVLLGGLGAFLLLPRPYDVPHSANGFARQLAARTPLDAPNRQWTELLKDLRLFNGQISLIDERTRAERAVTVTPNSFPSDARFAVEFRRGDPPRQLLAQLSAQPGFTRLSILSPDFESHSLEAVSQAASLQELELEARSISDSHIPWLKNLQGLQKLTIHQAKPLDMVRIGSLQQVEQLAFPEHDFDDHSLNFLANMVWLERLQLPTHNLSYSALTDLYFALPQCDFEFSNPAQAKVSELLLRLQRQAATPQAVEKVQRLIARHQEQLFSNPSTSSYWALRRYTTDFSAEDIAALHSAEDVTKVITLFRNALFMNELVSGTVQPTKRPLLLHNAALHWHGLGSLYLKAQHGPAANALAVQAFRQSIAAYEQLDPSENAAADLAHVSSCLARALASTNRQESQLWIDKSLALLAELPPLTELEPKQLAAAGWAWHELGSTLQNRSPRVAANYFENAGRTAQHVGVKHLHSAQALSWLEAAKLWMLQDRFAQAEMALAKQHKCLLRWKNYAGITNLTRHTLTVEAAYAILVDNQPLFVQATDQIANMPGSIPDGHIKDGVWELLCLRGWKKPFAAGEIQIASQALGRWPPAARKLAEGNLQLDSIPGLEELPPDNARSLWFQALQLRLETTAEPTAEPTAEQRQRATELLAEQCKRDDDWLHRATVLGLLGPLTGKPLATEFSAEALATRERLTGKPQTSEQLSAAAD